MLYLKSCPRCQGDMSTNRDLYGMYRECLQCGHIVDVETPDSPLSAWISEAKSSLPVSRAKKKVA